VFVHYGFTMARSSDIPDYIGLQAEELHLEQLRLVLDRREVALKLAIESAPLAELRASEVGGLLERAEIFERWLQR
jgi:hypothetical protein